jgi:hypothetical protein
MSVASIEYTIDETAVEGHDRLVEEVTAWLDRTASLRRPFTAACMPRHRADGPAV